MTAQDATLVMLQLLKAATPQPSSEANTDTQQPTTSNTSSAVHAEIASLHGVLQG